MHFFVFLGCFCPQPHDHIGWATSMPFASINSTNPRTNPWNFQKKLLRIGGIEKLSFFESAILNFKKNCFIPRKISQSFFGSKDGSKFLWLPWFSAQNNSCVNICNTVYIVSLVSFSHWTDFQQIWPVFCPFIE